MECPYGEGDAVLIKRPQTLTYRKEKFNIIAHFYVCQECKEEFTTNETDDITLIQVHNQYREKYDIPFQEEIREIREKYKLSAAKMSEILRLGENGYANYEKGEMPTPAIGTLIKTALKPANFHDLLIRHKKIETDNILIKAKNNLEKLIKEESEKHHLFELLSKQHDPNNFTGYSALNTTKIGNLLIHFIHSCNQDYNDRLKLVKLLFFTDFCHYKNYGRSVCGLSYQKNETGPVPVCYDYFFTYFEHHHMIYPTWKKIIDGGAREILSTNKLETAGEIFSEQEKSTINWVTEVYRNIPTWELVDKSNNLALKTTNELENHLIGFQENAFQFA